MKTKAENILEYKGPSSLEQIEKRLLEIEHEKPMRIHNMNENYPGDEEAEIENNEIAYLDVEKAQLNLKRQFILDERNGWKARVIWSILVPIVVSVIVTLVLLPFK
jgi:hypothetical protein